MAATSRGNTKRPPPQPVAKTCLPTTEWSPDEFIGVVAHELRGPLGNLKGYTQLLRRRAQQRHETEWADLLGRMDRQITMMANLINDLLDLSRLQSNMFSLRREVCAIDALVQETVEQMRLTSQPHRLCITGTTGVAIAVDHDRIVQVLINLLTNALKFSPEDAAVVVHLTGDAEQVTIGVQDFGIGIAPEHHAHIFEKFYQVKQSGVTRSCGVGLGLYIAAEIVRHHEGRIWLESTPGRGSTFFFTLPVQR